VCEWHYCDCDWGGKDGGGVSANAELQNIVGMDLLKCQIKYLMVV
jgi:hypothetical protein